MAPDLSAYLQSISRAYPDLLVQDRPVAFAGGQYNDVVIVGEALVFRFPRFAAGIRTLRQEVVFLRHVRGQLPLAVPDPLYTSLESGIVGQVFMGYRRLPGDLLQREALVGLDDETLAGLARQLARFLWTLHQLPVGELANVLPVSDEPGEWAGLYADIRQHLFAHMRPDARQEVAHHFESFLGSVRATTFEPALRHGDFGAGNILYDPLSRTVTGVIDFGSAGLGDPAVDIAATMTLGDRFFDYFRRAYPGIDSLHPRARFYRSTFALQEALYGVTHDDEEAFQAGMEDYL